jgi:hypothetical protein
MTKIRNKYDFLRLETHCNENNIKLLHDYKNITVNRDATIEAVCLTPDCNNIVNKRFRCFLDNGGCYCLKCVQQNRYNKIKNNCLKKYGVEHFFMSKDIIEKKKKTCLNNYGCENPTQSKEVMEKRKKTCLEKYGFENPNQSKEVIEKRKKTNLEKYGVEHVLELQEVINKRKKTMLDKYGVEHASQNLGFIQKKKETCLKKYGVENCFQSKEIIEKIKKTNIKKYGVEHPLQNKYLANKAFNNSYVSKPYILPSGKQINYQGYEHFALNEIINNFDENDIITGCKNVPKISYSDENGNLHYHFVDIFIKSQNKCIEVKSTWTLNNKKSNIFLKQKYAKESGYDYEIWVYNSKGEKVDCFK